MCKIVILEPKGNNTQYTKSSTLPSSPPQRRVDTFLVEKKVEKKEGDKNATSALPGALPTPSPNDANRSSVKNTSKVKGNAHDVVRNKFKNLKKPEKKESARNQQHIVPNAIGHSSVKPPPLKSRLPKNVRFTIDDKKCTKSYSTDSDDSYTDLSTPTPTPPDIYPISDQLQIPWNQSEPNKLQARHFPRMMEDTDPAESDTSSRVDIGEMVEGTLFPEWEEIFETQRPSVQQTSPLATQNAYGGEAPSNPPNQMDHNIAGSVDHARADVSTKFNLDQAWDSDSDQDSAIDSNELDFHIQTMNSDDVDKDWVPDQDADVNNGFYDWLEKLNDYPPQSSFSSDDFRSFLKYNRRGKEPAMSEMDPSFNVKMGAGLGQIN